MGGMFLKAWGVSDSGLFWPTAKTLQPHGFILTMECCFGSIVRVVGFRWRLLNSLGISQIRGPSSKWETDSGAL